MQSIFPVLKYDDARAAIDFLERAFGFERHAVYDGDDGRIAHAELRLGDEYVLLGSTGEGDDRFDQSAGHYSLYVVVEDPDAHHMRAREAGATIERELSDQDYGSREYTARDPEGNLWSFGTYRPSAAGTAAG
jgi:uncharacterized glyoxalase superfamily protein PhnB